MTRDDTAHLAFAICLIAVAGYVDAVGFLKLGNLFVSFMSGNSTQFAVVAAQGQWRAAGEAGGIVLLFVAGVTFGHLFALWAGAWRRPAVLIADAALLGLAILLGPAPAAMIPTVIAMGLQNEAQHKAGEFKTSLTYVTGTLVSLGEHLAGALSGSEPEKRWHWIGYLLLWCGLVGGAAVGRSSMPIRRSRRCAGRRSSSLSSRSSRPFSLGRASAETRDAQRKSRG